MALTAQQIKDFISNQYAEQIGATQYIRRTDHITAQSKLVDELEKLSEGAKAIDLAVADLKFDWSKGYVANADTAATGDIAIDNTDALLGASAMVFHNGATAPGVVNGAITQDPDDYVAQYKPNQTNLIVFTVIGFDDVTEEVELLVRTPLKASSLVIDDVLVLGDFASTQSVFIEPINDEIRLHSIRSPESAASNVIIQPPAPFQSANGRVLYMDTTAQARQVVMPPVAGIFNGFTVGVFHSSGANAVEVIIQGSTFAADGVLEETPVDNGNGTWTVSFNEVGKGYYFTFNSAQSKWYATDKISGTSLVTVNGVQGPSITIDTDDVDEGLANLYYTEDRVSANSDVVANTAKVGVPAGSQPGLVVNNYDQSPAGHDVTLIPIIDNGGFLKVPDDNVLIALLQDDANWTGGEYTGGTAITGTVQGQAHYNEPYLYQAIADNVWVRVDYGVGGGGGGVDDLTTDLDTNKYRIGFAAAAKVTAVSGASVTVSLDDGITELDMTNATPGTVTITLASAQVATWKDVATCRIIFRGITDNHAITYANARTGQNTFLSMVPGRTYQHNVIQYGSEMLIESSQSYSFDLGAAPGGGGLDLATILDLHLDARETERTANSWTLDASNNVVEAVDDAGNQFTVAAPGWVAAPGTDYILTDDIQALSLPPIDPGSGPFTWVIVAQYSGFGAIKQMKHGGANWVRVDSNGITISEGSGAIPQVQFSTGNFNTAQVYFVVVKRQSSGLYVAYRLNSNISNNPDNIEVGTTQPASFGDSVGATLDLKMEDGNKVYFLGYAKADVSLADIKSLYTELKSRFSAL